MKPILFYDSETTGMVDWQAPSEAPQQPHMVQLAACLVDIDTWSMIAGMDVIVRPDGWTIPDEVASIHGITTETASKLGVAEHIALSMFLDLWSCAEFRVAHNESFDQRIVRIAIKRHIGDKLAEGATATAAEIWAAGRAQCTAKMATPICKLPPTAKMVAAGRRHHKTPNLAEAYMHFFGTAFDGAHSANADMQACLAIYRAMTESAPKAAANDEGQPAPEAA